MSSDFIPLIEAIQQRYGVCKTTANRWRREYKHILRPLRGEGRRLMVRPCVLSLLDQALEIRELAK